MATTTIPNKPNVTLVAFYDKDKTRKSDSLRELIKTVRDKVVEVAHNQGGLIFEPYPLEQVHATILGCEGGASKRGVLSKWFLEKRGEERYIQFENLIPYFRWHSNLPIIVRFCNYCADVDYGFTSRDLHPYSRSFQITTERFAVLMGWPYRAGQWPLALDQFRLGAQRCNALHQYHSSLASVDNDCYLRVGIFKGDVERKVAEKIENAVRPVLAAKAPIYEGIDATTLCIAKYQTTTLELESTDVWELGDMPPEKMRGLYPSVVAAQ